MGMAVEIRMKAIERETALCNEEYSNSYNEAEKRKLESKMSRLATEYLNLAEKLG